MGFDEIANQPEMAELQRLLQDAGCAVNVHNSHGEWFEIHMPNGQIAKIEWVHGPRP